MKHLPSPINARQLDPQTIDRTRQSQHTSMTDGSVQVPLHLELDRAFLLKQRLPLPNNAVSPEHPLDTVLRHPASYFLLSPLRRLGLRTRFPLAVLGSRGSRACVEVHVYQVYVHDVKEALVGGTCC